MKQLTVLSHNTFWFQGVPFATDRPAAAHREVAKRLCTIYRKIDPDVICLQEIQDREAFAMVSECLGMSGYYSRGTRLPQYGGAIFWRSDIACHVSDSRRSNPAPQRIWQIIAVQAGDRCLRIGHVHLPSARQLGPERASAQRIAELQALIQGCAAGPDMIVGDFNEQPGGFVGDCLRNHGYLDAAVLSNRSCKSTNISERRGDYAWIKKPLADGGLTYDVIPKQKLAWSNTGKQYLSDHLPLWLTVGITIEQPEKLSYYRRVCPADGKVSRNRASAGP